MDDLEIFEKAIKQALDLKYYYIQGLAKDVYAMIFSHNFAKAFWGEDDITYCLSCSEQNCVCMNTAMMMIPKYKYHLQQMVLKENPLKYIEKFLNDEKN